MNLSPPTSESCSQQSETMITLFDIDLTNSEFPLASRLYGLEGVDTLGKEVTAWKYNYYGNYMVVALFDQETKLTNILKLRTDGTYD